jgi:methionyl-tRNA formyltransferase
LRILLLGDGLWAVHALNHLRTFCELPWVVGRRQATDSCFESACHDVAIPFVQPDNINSPDWISRIKRIAPDLLLSVSYDQIFKPSFLEQLPCPVINIHAGDPSRYRGRAILTWQLIEGCRSIDLCAIRVDEGIDTGLLLAKKTVPMDDSPYYGAALERVSNAVPALLTDLFLRHAQMGIAAFETGLSPSGGDVCTSQPHPPRQYPRRRPGDEWLDWSCTTELLLRSIRALSEPNPLAAVLFGDRRLLVVKASTCKDVPDFDLPAGSIISLSEDVCSVKTADGALSFHELRDASGQTFPMSNLHLGECFTSPGNHRLRRVEQDLSMTGMHP